MIGWLSTAAGTARTVGMGEIALASSSERLQCIGLGSCLAIVAFDLGAAQAGLAHAMLPSPLGSDADAPPAKYASEAVRNLATALSARGASLAEVRIALVGGAQLIAGHTGKGAALPQLGQRNAEEARLAVLAFGFTLVAEDLGGTIGRTVTFDPATGEVFVRTTTNGSRTLCNLRTAE